MPGGTWNQYASYIADEETKNKVKDTVYEVSIVLTFIMLAKWLQGEPPPSLRRLVLFFILLSSILVILHRLRLDASSVAEGVMKGQLFNRILSLIT